MYLCIIITYVHGFPRAESLASEIKELQGQLADYNTVSIKTMPPTIFYEHKSNLDYPLPTNNFWRVLGQST